MATKIKEPIMKFDFSISALTGAALMLGLASAWGDGTESLGTPSISVGSGTGIVGAGTGLDDGPSTININVPGAVVQALLYWSCFDTDGNLDDQIILQGTPIDGSLIGGPTLFFSGLFASTHRADITDFFLVSSGPNSLAVDGLDCANDREHGAGLLVIFDDSVSAAANIQIRDGNDLAFIGFVDPLDRTVPQTFSFASSEVERTADLVMFFSSVAQDALRPTAVDITTNGSSGTTTELNNLLGSNDGHEWDTVNISVSVPAGTTMLTAQAFSEDRLDTESLPASFNWSAAGMAIREDVPPGLDGRITGGGSNFTIDDVRITKGLQLHCDLRDPNNFEINWQGNSFHLLELVAANCTEDPNIIQQPPKSSPFDTFNGSGTGRLKIKGTTDFGASIDFILVDDGEPGVDDSARIEIKNGAGDVVLFVEGFLDKGNFQTHKD
jgi:hypothetical protein